MSSKDDGFDAFMHSLGFTKVDRNGNTFPPPPILPKKNIGSPFLNVDDFIRLIKDIDFKPDTPPTIEEPLTQDNSECPGCTLCMSEDEDRPFEEEDLGINKGSPNDTAVINVSVEGQSAHDFVQFANVVMMDLVREYQARGGNLTANIVVNTSTEIRH